MPNMPVKVFHAGTAMNEKNEVVTASGRVLGVASYSKEGLAKAMEQAYDAANFIDAATTAHNTLNVDLLIHRVVFHYRMDIGLKGLK